MFAHLSHPSDGILTNSAPGATAGHIGREIRESKICKVALRRGGSSLLVGVPIGEHRRKNPEEERRVYADGEDRSADGEDGEGHAGFGKR